MLEENKKEKILKLEWQHKNKNQKKEEQLKKQKENRTEKIMKPEQKLKDKELNKEELKMKHVESKIEKIMKLELKLKDNDCKLRQKQEDNKMKSVWPKEKQRNYIDKKL